jgi:hypothetical protein
MTQMKVFKESDLNRLETNVNWWLCENDARIDVVNISSGIVPRDTRGLPNPVTHQQMIDRGTQYVTMIAYKNKI